MAFIPIGSLFTANAADVLQQLQCIGLCLSYSCRRPKLRKGLRNCRFSTIFAFLRKYDPTTGSRGMGIDSQQLPSYISIILMFRSLLLHLKLNLWNFSRAAYSRPLMVLLLWRSHVRRPDPWAYPSTIKSWIRPFIRCIHYFVAWQRPTIHRLKWRHSSVVTTRSPLSPYVLVFCT